LSSFPTRRSSDLSTTSTFPSGIVCKASLTNTLSSNTLTVEIGPEKAVFLPNDVKGCLQITNSFENSSHKSAVLNPIQTTPVYLFCIHTTLRNLYTIIVHVNLPKNQFFANV